MSKLVILPIALVATVAHGAVGDNRVGIAVHNGTQAFIDGAVGLGVGWVRVDANWFLLEPANGAYQWGYVDDAVTRARTAGLGVYLTLAYTPDWVARHGDTDGIASNDVPDNAADWADFVGVAVSRYRAIGVTHFGIWNEPNLDHFFEGSATEYVNTILLPAAAAVRVACSDCFVLGPDLAHVGNYDDFLADVLSLAPTTFDIIAHHNYHGFTETGWNIFSGDSYMSALDQQRPFSRRDLRQVLDGAGYSGEVWITEAGYLAAPGNGQEENLQATYWTRALDEQLARPWITNTFFYEINDCGVDQPACTIDGYGAMRPTAGIPGQRRFPSDFRLKPVFTALPQFLAAHPEIDGLPQPLACADGFDNDNDGRVDLDDRGCSDGADDDESDDPPRTSVTGYHTPGIAIDGDVADAGADGWVTLDAGSWVGDEALDGPSDCAADFAVRWDSAALYFAVVVTDEQHDNSEGTPTLWVGDSLQLAFDVGANGGDGYDPSDDHELIFARVNGASLANRYVGPAAAADDFDARIERTAGATTYEARIALTSLPGFSPVAGGTLRFSLLVNDADGSGRAGWLELTPGIGTAKAPEWFAELHLVSANSGGIVNPGDNDLPTPGDDAPLQSDGGPQGGDAPPQRGDVAMAGDTSFVGGDAFVSGDPRPRSSSSRQDRKTLGHPGGSGCAAAPMSLLAGLACAIVGLRRRRRTRLI